MTSAHEVARFPPKRSLQGDKYVFEAVNVSKAYS